MSDTAAAPRAAIAVLDRQITDGTCGRDTQHLMLSPGIDHRQILTLPLKGTTVRQRKNFRCQDTGSGNINR